jgi:hypothetical protein
MLLLVKAATQVMNSLRFGPLGPETQMNFEEVTNQIVKDQTFKAVSQKAPAGKQLTTDFSTTKK